MASYQIDRPPRNCPGCGGRDGYIFQKTHDDRWRCSICNWEEADTTALKIIIVVLGLFLIGIGASMAFTMPNGGMLGIMFMVTGAVGIISLRFE